ncbi:GT-D fold domain-containing glycosyltransferase [Marinobacterium rhizophilum]|uniref:GT-D fold domain-containing glycosyltransferase n=1 Tax=Marinobacterium rhizophilum TaxID=420402 RepID=UPI0003663E79|nr:GT-D fold domain-containing glycosyltransferase [Marinobacterium rhizophilum]
MSKLKKKVLRALLRQVAILGAPFILGASRRTRFREYFDSRIIALHHDDIEEFVAQYPKVWSEEETIRHLIEHRSSICRFGDGEFKLMVGERHKSFQDVNPALNSRMLEVLHSNDPNTLIAIHPVRDFDGLGRIWQKFIIRIGREVLELLERDRDYPSMGAFRTLPRRNREEFVARIKLIKQIWDGRKILMVVGTNSRFTFEPELFNNAQSVDFLYAPAKNAFNEYDDIVKRITQYDKDEYLIMPVLGPTATILAYDLARMGYQAIDFGQMPGTFRRAKWTLFGSEDFVIKELIDTTKSVG